jgi:hypothetical protein
VKRQSDNALKTWSEAVLYFRAWQLGLLTCDSKPYRSTMADCQLAGFATPMEVARGGRA